jgi:hypothetical protein
VKPLLPRTSPQRAGRGHHYSQATPVRVRDPGSVLRAFTEERAGPGIAQVGTHLTETIEKRGHWKRGNIYSPFVTPIRRGESNAARYVATAPVDAILTASGRGTLLRNIYSGFPTGE